MLNLKIVSYHLILLVILFFSSCCSGVRKYYEQMYNRKVISIAYIPFQPKDTFQIVVLAYKPGKVCMGKDTFCAICFCAIIPTGEILEIQSACFSDSTIKAGDKLNVVPYTAFSPFSWKTKIIYIQEYGEHYIHPLHAHKHKTTFGELIKMN